MIFRCCRRFTFPASPGCVATSKTARFGQHVVSAASLPLAFGPITTPPRRNRCTSKSSPHSGLAPSRRRIGFGAANTAAHCRSSGAAFPGSPLFFATFTSGASLGVRGCITIRSSRCRFAARLNSGVSRHEQQHVVGMSQELLLRVSLGFAFRTMACRVVLRLVRGARIRSCCGSSASDWCGLGCKVGLPQVHGQAGLRCVQY